MACDFFCKTIWTLSGKRGAYCLFFIHVGTRKAWVFQAIYHPNEAWVRQQARNVLMWLEDQELQATHLIHDRDTKFTASFDRLMGTANIDIVKSPVMAPNANAFAEAWVGSIKQECLDYFVCFGLKHFDHLVQAYAGFYSTHRPHQGKGNQALRLPGQALKYTGKPVIPLGSIECTETLGGLLKSYRRAA